jgi:hypothetical protein
MTQTAQALADQGEAIRRQMECTQGDGWGLDPVAPRIEAQPVFRTQRTAATSWPNCYRAEVARRVTAETTTADERLQWLLTLAQDLGVINRIETVLK